MREPISRQVIISIFEIFAIFVVPVILLVTGWLPLPMRQLLAIPVSILILQSVLRERWSLKKLGIRADNFRESVMPYVIFTLVGLFLILILAKIQDRHMVVGWLNKPHFQFFFFLTSFFQEFTYRGYLTPKLEALTESVPTQIVINSLLFSALHYFFPQQWVVLPATFILGVALTTMYKRYPNLLLISIAHSIFNFTAVMFCFASMNISCSRWTNRFLISPSRN